VEMDADGYIISCSYSFDASVITIPETLDGYTVKGIANSSYTSGIFASKAIVSVQLPSTIEKIGGYAFKINLMASVDIPNTVTDIGVATFSQNQLTSLDLPDSIINLGSYAFSSNKITEVTIPNRVTYISPGLFGSNQLTNVTIPNSVIRIGEHAFGGNQLSGFALPSPALTGFVDWVDTKSGTEYEGGDTVTDFTGNYVARFAYILTDDDVVMDANGYIISSSYIGTERNIIIPDTLDGIKVIGIADGAADGVSVKGTANVAATSGVFYNKSLSSVTLPLALEYIGAYAFNSNQLRSVTIPNSVVFIGEHAFAINLLTGFELPIPDIPGFLNWVDTKSGTEYEGGDTVTDFTGIYVARFAIFADGFEGGF